jgi:hypothetical protein
MAIFERLQKYTMKNGLLHPDNSKRAATQPAYRSPKLTWSNRSGRNFIESCGRRLPAPALCPFGGACHACPARVQAKLTVSQANDPYEQEADRVAGQMMTMPEPKVQRQEESQEEEEVSVQTKPVIDSIQRQEDPVEGEEPIQTKSTGNLFQMQETGSENDEPVQTKREGCITLMSSRGFDAQINSLQGGGSPLPQGIRGFFEPRFGHDLSQVRIHDTPREAKMADLINAQAFTVHRDIIFNVGKYKPQTAAGKQLIAHELTHVIQQSKNEGTYHSSQMHTPLLRRRRGPKFSSERPPIRVKGTLNEILGKLLRDASKTSVATVKNNLKVKFLKFLKQAPNNLEDDYAKYKRCLIENPLVLRKEIKAAFPRDADRIIKLLPKRKKQGTTWEEVLAQKEKERIKQAEDEFPLPQRERIINTQKKYRNTDGASMLLLWVLENWIAIRNNSFISKMRIPQVSSPKSVNIEDAHSCAIEIAAQTNRMWIILNNVICVKDTPGPATPACCQELRNWMKLFKEVAPKGESSKIMRGKVKWMMEQEKYKYCKFTSVDKGS